MKPARIITALGLALCASASASVFAADAPLAETPSFSVGAGKAKLNLLLQSWMLSDSTATAAKSNFRIRRTELKLSGSASETVRWFIMIDPSKSLKSGAVSSSNDNKVLQDLGVGVQLGGGFELVAGQAKILTTAEALDSSGSLPLPERSMMGRTYGDKRQVGLQIFYKKDAWKAGLMLSNGGNANADDASTAKDMSLRVDYEPWKGLAFGGFVAAADFRFADYGRYGMNARWKGAAESLRFELVQAEDSSTGTKISSSGYSAETGYEFAKWLQPVVRYEKLSLDSNSDLSSRAFTFGINSPLDSGARVQAAYSILYNTSGSNGSYSGVATGTEGPGRLFIVNLQVSI